jgi:hypothetical protein
VGIKQSWHEADPSPAYNSDIKNDWSCVFPAVVCLKSVHRGDFTFYLYLICTLFDDAVCI